MVITSLNYISKCMDSLEVKVSYLSKTYMLCKQGNEILQYTIFGGVVSE